MRLLTKIGFPLLAIMSTLPAPASLGQTRPQPLQLLRSSGQDNPTRADILPLDDPTMGEVRLEARAGWRASLVIDEGETGIWTVESHQIFEPFGSPEVIGLDDKGHCLVIASYSGKWFPYPVVDDGKWLGAMAHADVDPRRKGAELYVGGQRGNLYQVLSYRHVALDCRLIAHLPGREIHTIVAGKFDPQGASGEVLVFTRPGGLWRFTPTGADGRFEGGLVEELAGRVRDALVLPSDPGRPTEIVTVSRAGTLESLRFESDGPHWTLIDKQSMGRGRIAMLPPRTGAAQVLYTTLDDGRIMRHERLDGTQWRSETIYLGPQGARGVAAGRFDADPDVETVAVFGYGKRVELLRRAEGGWQAETIFEDREKGHWLEAAELDGRNATRELLASGYGGRIVLLARPPGYGRPEPARD